jgi:hypothetical protein
MKSTSKQLYEHRDVVKFAKGNVRFIVKLAPIWREKSTIHCADQQQDVNAIANILIVFEFSHKQVVFQ